MSDRPHPPRAVAFIGIGSNLGDGLDNCREAARRLDRMEQSRVVKVSAFYRTEPVGFVDQDWFVNCAALLETALDPRRLLQRLQEIENDMGRVRTVRWGPRIIDLDLLFYDDLVLDDPGLTIPHPEIHRRGFVLHPLNDLDPDKVHPVLGKTVSRLLEELPDRKEVRRIP